MSIGEEFHGRSTEFDDSRFLNYSTLALGAEATLTIKQPKRLPKGFKFENGRKLDKPALILEFIETPKVLKLNAGNRATMARMYGTKTDPWIGKKIICFGDPTVKFAGQEVGGVVIRNQKVTQSAS